MKYITVNYDSLESINKAEKEKTILENKGFKLIHEQQTGINKFILTFKK